MERACGPHAWQALGLLRAKHACTQTQLGKRLGIRQPSVSALLTDLERLGLARRAGMHQGARGRPTQQWDVIDANVDQLVTLGDELVAHSTPHSGRGSGPGNEGPAAHPA
jgi:predicted ArsR family transcriptional regulator